VHNAYKVPGGEDVCVHAERRLLEQHGHTVRLEQANNDQISGAWNSVKVGLSTTYSWPERRRLFQILTEFSPDVAHIHNFFPLLSPSIYYACHEAGVPVVQTLHNYRLLCPSATFFRDGKVCEECLGKIITWPGVLHGCYRGSRLGTAAVGSMLVTHRVLRTFKNKVGVYIAPSEFARQKFVQGGLPSSKIEVKPHFVDPDPGMGSGDGDFVLFAGRLSEEKGIRTILRAWQSLGNRIPLKIAGSGPLTPLVEQHQGNGIELLGFVPIPDIYDLMGEAKAMVFASEWFETFGFVVIESYAKGTPVIASKLGAMETLIDHQRTGLHFEATNAEDLTRQVCWMLDHPDHWEWMRRQARMEYETRYTGEKNYELLTSIYSKAMETCNAPL
jgi:glycosyltransferase involved in cell wall biosynthesis